MKRVAGPGLALALSLVAAACTGGDSSPTTSDAAAPATTEAEPVATTAILPADGEGRLLVLGEDGNLSTMRSDGSDRIDLTSGAGEQLQFSQPTWSPDGSRIAWTKVDGRDGRIRTSLVTARFDGSDRTEAATAFAPFYLYWDPTAERLAYLGTGANQLEMGILDAVGGGTEAATIDDGQPYYFSWSPAGDRMLVHVGIDRLELLDLDGTADPLGTDPGAFQAPNWIGDTQLYVARDGEQQSLVVRDAGEGGERTLVEFGGFIQFSLSRDGSQVAFQVAGGPSEDQGVVAAGQNAVLAAAPLAQEQTPRGSLSVLDVASGEITTLTLDLSLAFFWGPDGRLLSLHTADLPDGERWFRWKAWADGEELVETERFRPSLVFARDYLPFFGQYALSMSPWAPDGSAFTYPGATQDGETGIWVQPASDGATGTLIADGVFSAWSQG